MKPVIDHLPLTIHQHAPRWTCGCQFIGTGVMPHFCPKHNLPPVIELVDTVSGIEQLDGRRAWHERLDPTVPIWLFIFALGALCVAILFLFLK